MPETEELSEAPVPSAPEEPEVKGYKLTGDHNIKGQDCAAGTVVPLTQEEYETLKALGAPIEGVEPKSEEDAQAEHDELRDAQEERLHPDWKPPSDDDAEEDEGEEI